MHFNSWLNLLYFNNSGSNTYIVIGDKLYGNIGALNPIILGQLLLPYLLSKSFIKLCVYFFSKCLTLQRRVPLFIKLVKVFYKFSYEKNEGSVGLTNKNGSVIDSITSTVLWFLALTRFIMSKVKIDAVETESTYEEVKILWMKCFWTFKRVFRM